MRSDSKTYEAVAQNCSAFSPVGTEKGFSNSVSNAGQVSCVNCKHFTDGKYCELDLYDEIVENKNL